MADYYPLIARAVAGLEKNTGDARRALYERARSALVAQLRGVNPPLSENDVTRERLALEESIRKVEAEAARKNWVDPASGAAQARVRAPEFPRWDVPQATGAGDEPPRNLAPRRAEQGHVRQAAQAAARPLRSPDPAIAPGPLTMEVFDQPLSVEPVLGPPVRPVTARAKPDRRPPQEAPPASFNDPIPDTGGADNMFPRVVRPARENVASPLPASHDFDRIDTRPLDSHGSPLSGYPTPMLEQGHGGYDEPRMHPTSGRPGAALERASRRSFGDIVRIALTLLVLAGLGGVIVWQWPNVASLYRSARAPAPPPQVVVDSQPSKSQPKKIPDRLDPGGGGTAAQPKRATLQTGPAPAGAAVAQKVVLYEEDPSNPQGGGGQFVGSAIWRTERVSAAPGQPEEIVVRADVEIPDRKLAMTWSLRRNTDQSLSASHTIEVIFRVPLDFPPGSIAHVPGILMKQDEQTRGAPLAGSAVKITDSYYLIGLSSIEVERDQNLRMLKEQGWFDIPVVYGNKRRALLAVEKGIPGDRAFAEAFAAWRQ
jgi:hypothetical protein